MSKIWEYIKIALMNIRSNKGRSFLTMLGIIIGISSVILIVSTGSGVKGGVSGQLNDLVGGYGSMRRMTRRIQTISNSRMKIWMLSQRR